MMWNRMLTSLLGVLLLFPAVGRAAFEFQPSSVTIGAGPAKLNDGIGTTFFLSGRVDLGTFNDNLVWDAGLQWWKKSETTTFTVFDLLGQPSLSEVKTSYRNFALQSGVKYLFQVDDERFLPHVRGGLSLNFVDATIETVSGATTESFSGGDTDLGVYLGGGFGYRYSPTLLFGVETAYHITDADHFVIGLTVSFPLTR